MIVSVRDQGKGISSLERLDLFKSFGRLENKVVDSNHMIDLCGSTGIGLFNVKQFLTRVGGDVWISWSEENVGTEFTFAIPFSLPNESFDQENFEVKNFLKQKEGR
jgi:signal transduction histidine kinase